MDNKPRILRLILPGTHSRLRAAIQRDYPQALEGNHPVVVGVGKDIRRYLEGEDIRFDLSWLAWEICTDFQTRVLQAEYGIPRGWVSTYGRIAEKVGVPGGSRAVGNALAANPFPLLIPCHRAVRATGELGGYQGGLQMKKSLLIMEGVAFRSGTKVAFDKVYY